MSEPANRAPLAAAVSEAAAARADLTEGEQLDLLPVPRGLDDGRADRVRAMVGEHRRAGRPPGAKNKTTREALDFVRQVLGDPLIERARVAMHTPESLSAWLGCSKFEAAQHLDGIRADLQRLFYAPLAPVDGAGNPVAPLFQMSIGGPMAGAPGPGRLPWEYAEEPQQNQSLAPPAEAVSHADVSHGDDK